MKTYEKPQITEFLLVAEQLFALSIIEGGTADPGQGVLAPPKNPFKPNWNQFNPFNPFQFPF